jgi:hypothetical protein
MVEPRRRLGAVRSEPASRRSAMPNPSFNRTRYGRHRKAGLRHMLHHLSPALRCLPPRAGQLER